MAQHIPQSHQLPIAQGIRPEDLLALPWDFHDGAKAWKQLTTDNTLVESLRDALHERHPDSWDSLQHLVTTWEDSFIPYRLEELPHLLSAWARIATARNISERRELEKERQRLPAQPHIVRRLLWCAEQAAQQQTATITLPPFLSGQEDIASVWIRTFRNAPAISCRIPVALCDRETGQGFLAELLLDVLPEGADRVGEHPADAFLDRDSAFTNSFRHAWQAVRQHLPADDVRATFDGRYRLLQDGQPVNNLSGASVSGAAAWGWHDAILGRVYDPRVIVLAQIRDDLTLDGVDGVAAKTEAIVAAGRRFDTIVVASEANRIESESVLRQHGRQHTIRVVLPQ